jgi:hypothetical protein
VHDAPFERIVDAQQCSVSCRKDNVDTQAVFDSVINSWYSSAGSKGTMRFTSPGVYVGGGARGAHS